MEKAVTANSRETIDTGTHAAFARALKRTSADYETRPSLEATLARGTQVEVASGRFGVRLRCVVTSIEYGLVVLRDFSGQVHLLTWSSASCRWHFMWCERELGALDDLQVFS